MIRWILLVVWILSAGGVVAQDTLRISLAFTGDIMQHDSQIQAAWNPATGQYDYRPCFAPVTGLLAAADLTLGNLELTFGGKPYKGYPTFSAPEALAPALKEAGYDVLVTANNHCADRGRAGLEHTIAVLDSMEFMHTGTFRDTLEWLNEHPLVIQKNGFTLALLNYTYGTNGMPVNRPVMVNRIDTLQMLADFQRAREMSTDAIIVFFHWGQEYVRLPGDFQKKLASFCFRQGARIVIGSHPHVLQPMEWNKERDEVVAWSLGNFVSGQYDRYRNGGAVFHIDLQKIPATGKTRVADASYSLTFVHRANDSRRTYSVLPVKAYESDTLTLRTATAREKFRLFVEDARVLLGTHNLNVTEKK